MKLLDLFKKKDFPIDVHHPEALEKTVKPLLINDSLEGEIEKHKVVFGLDSKRMGVDNVYTKYGRLSDKDLKMISQYDSIISLIISTRSNQANSFGKRSRNKYDRGFGLREVLPAQDDPNIPKDQKTEACTQRTKLADVITKWVYNCGITDKQTLDYVFEGSDTTFKTCSFGDFCSAQARNLLTYNRAATQVIRAKNGVPLLFRPIPVETLYRVIDGRRITLSLGDQDVDDTGAEDAKIYNDLPESQKPIAYVQRIDGKNVSFFTEDEIKLTYLQKQAFEGLEGYPLAPIELAYYSILIHINAQKFLENSMTKGLAAKGFISIKYPEGGVVSKVDVENFRKMFSNYVARNDNSATIPVISGPVDVKFERLHDTPQDMEFINLHNRVLQILCASFAISPHEIGFGALDPGDKSTVSDGMKQEQIVQGEERGLRQILEKLFLSVMEIVTETFPDAKETFLLEPIGLGQNTKEGDLALYKEELQTSGTFAKIWADSERSESFPYGGHVPTSPIFHANVAKYMKYSMFLYHFFGEKDALTNPAYDFIIDPALNEAYQTLKAQKPQMEAEQMQLQTEQMQMQNQQMGQQPPPGQEEAQQGEEQADPALQEKEIQMQSAEHKQKMQMEKEKHDQKIQMEREKHQLNLRLAYQKALAERQHMGNPNNAFQKIINGAKTKQIR